ncbi:hypothetical protein Clacol_006206 [Clathrus columnatus]|uniref:Uncharacterized protein n=1 Tax=Clathrus columnatus TaxID=1419009 RepID=A0AAV5AH00_9AGAM|nr:hypothetical protein Clacol_006206 [Clathrus columnatus]
MFTAFTLYGGELYNPNPAHGLCVAQTAFTYGTVPMASMASFMFVLQVYLSLKRILSNNVVPPSRVWNMALLSFASTVGDVPPGLAAVGIVGALVVLVLLAVKVFYNWQSFRRLDNASQDLTTGLIIRALIFTCFSIVAVLLCAALISTKDGNMVASGIFLALRKFHGNHSFEINLTWDKTVPVAVFIVFGIQRDLGRLIHIPSRKTESSEATRGIQVQLEVTVTQTVSKSSYL